MVFLSKLRKKLDPPLKMAEVKVLGMWASPFSYRVKWALELKGIPYEYVEVDINNKTPLLLQHNPVHKKIPVLIHGGKPICESVIILEYIDETWPQNPVFPTDPFEKAVARFWINFAESKEFAGWMLRSGSREEQVKSRTGAIERLRIIEEQCLGDKKFFGGDEIGAVDLVFGGLAHWLGILEEVAGENILDADEFPRLHAWTKNFKKVPAIKDNLPDRDKIVELFKRLRQSPLKSAEEK